MIFDVVLPIAFFIFIAIVVFLYTKLEKKIKKLFGGETKLGKRDVLLLILAMGIMTTVVAFIPNLALQIFYVSVFSYTLFSFAYLSMRKWYVAIVPPILFVASYLFFWNTLTFNIFAFALASITIMYLGTLFSWKTTLIFAGLLTVLDFIQVFITGFMGQLAEKAVFQLKLPVVIMLPTYPAGGSIILGLGDIFLTGLLALQSLSRDGLRAGIITAGAISVALFIFEIVEFNTRYFTYFPATIVVLLGWLLGMGIIRLTRKM